MDAKTRKNNPLREKKSETITLAFALIFSLSGVKVTVQAVSLVHRGNIFMHALPGYIQQKSFCKITAYLEL